MPVDVRLAALGLVTGTVVEAGTLQPLKGWTVTLSQTLPSGRPVPELRTMAGIDGGFSFPGAAVGSFRVTASKAGTMGSGQATGAIVRGGQAVDVPVVVAVHRAARGRVAGAVVDADGSPAGSAQVEVLGVSGRRTVTAGPDGTFAIEDLPLGRFTVKARAQASSNQGVAVGEITFEGQTANVLVALVGNSVVRGTVYTVDLSGVQTPAAGVSVVLEATPATGCAAECRTFTNAQGEFEFTNVAARSFTVTATHPTTGQSGAVGDTVNPGGTRTVSVVIEAAGSVRGVATFANGTPAANIVAELSQGSRKLFVESGSDGTFEFKTVSIAGNRTYTLSLSDPIGSGLARRSITVNGALDLGIVVLDEAPPAVAQTTPPSGATGVSRTADIVIQFTEPITRGSLGPGDVVLLAPSGPVSGRLTVADDDLSVTFTPDAPLADQTLHTIKVEGIDDRMGRGMAAPYVGTFTTVDVTPPSIADLSPGQGASGVAVTAVVRVKFSEAVDPARVQSPAITLTGPAGPVAGQATWLFGNTVLAFTPDFPLAENALYQVQLATMYDFAGNAFDAPGFAFSTTDRTPPTLAGLTPVGGPTVIENAVKEIVAETGGTQDIAFVDFSVNGVFAYTARRQLNQPFSFAFQAQPAFGGPGDQVRISAVATDTSGNRGAVPVETLVTITPDQAPTLSIVAPATGARVANGQYVTVSVQGADDLGLVQLGYVARTGNPSTAGTRTFTTPQVNALEMFGFEVPAAAAPGTRILVEASAIDTKGQIAQAAPIEVVVQDAAAPTVSIGGATSGERVRPGDVVRVVVSAQDPGGIAALGFSVGGPASSPDAGERVIAPAQTTVASTFELFVAASASANESITIDAYAIDASGNRANANRLVLSVIDGSVPTITLRTADNRTTFVPGRAFSVVAEASDDAALQRIDLQATGALAFTRSEAVTGGATAKAVTFTIDVPASVPEGAELTLTARAVDLTNNVSEPATLTLTAQTLADVTMPASLLVVAGETPTFTIELPAPAPAEGVRVDLSSSDPDVAASMEPFVVFTGGESSTTASVAGLSSGNATIQASIGGIERASMTVTVRGGVVRGTVWHEGAPVAGASVTIASGASRVTTTTDSAGEYFVENVAGPSITVKAAVDGAGLLGFASGTMARAYGFVTLNVVLTELGAISGDVVDAAQAPAGAGVRVDLYQGEYSGLPLATTFTGSGGSFRFELLSAGTYLLQATDTQGNIGRASAVVAGSGEDVPVTVSFELRGSVAGIVRSASGAPVSGAEVKLTQAGGFGTVPAVSRTTDVEGRFGVDPVFVGSFSVTAFDPVSRRAGSATGEVTSRVPDAQVEVTLAPWGRVRGTVYRHGGTVKAGPGIAVSLDACGPYGGENCAFSAVTDQESEFLFEYVPLSNYVVTARETGTRAFGSASGTLVVNEQTKVTDVVFHGQGAVEVSVIDGSSNPVAGAQVTVTSVSGALSDTLSGTTGDTGQVRLENLLAGTASVTARKGLLSGSAAATITAGTTTQVTVKLQETGTIRVSAFLPNDSTPATSGRVYVYNACLGCGQVANVLLTEENGGVVEIGNLPLGTYALAAYDAGNRRRAIARDIVLGTHGQVEERRLTFVGLGTVRGRVTYNGLSQPNLYVGVTGGAPDFPFSAGDYTDAAGEYVVENVPVGPVVASASDWTNARHGEQNGQMLTDGQSLQLDIVMQSSSTTMPYLLTDAQGHSIWVYGNGMSGGGLRSVFTHPNTFTALGMRLEILKDGVATAFAGSSVGILEDGKREVSVRQNGVAGLNVTRKVAVPADGYFARYLEILSNPTGEPITVDVRVSSQVASVNGASTVQATSSGDAVLEAGSAAADNWVVVDDTNDGDALTEWTAPPVAFVFDGPGAADAADAASVTPTDLGRTALTWQQVTIPAGGTVAFLHFASQQTSRAAAVASAERLVQLPPEALAGLNEFERSWIRNFAVPADGSSQLEALPPLTGQVSGEVVEGDGTTIVPAAKVIFTSTVPMFSRSYEVTATTAGTFSYVPGTGRPVPLAPISVVAKHPDSGVVSAPVIVDLSPSTPSRTERIPFAGTGLVRLTPTRLDGTVLPEGQVTRATVRLQSPTYSKERILTSPGSTTFAGVPAGEYVATVIARHVQSSTDVSSSEPITVTPNTTTAADIRLRVGGIAGVVTDSTGAPVGGVTITIENVGGTYFYRSTSTAPGTGAFLSTDVRPGDFRVTASHPASGQAHRVTVTVVEGQNADASIQFPPVGSIVATLRRASGAIVDGTVTLTSPSGATVSRSTTGGEVRFEGLQVGTYGLAWTPAGRAELKVTTSVTLTAEGDVASSTLVAQPYGSIGGPLTRGNGTSLGSCVVRVYENEVLIPGSICPSGTPARWSFDGLRAGLPIRVRVQHPDSVFEYKDYTFDPISTDGEVIPAAVSAPARAMVRVTVRDAAGSPVRAVVSMADKLTATPSQRGTTNATTGRLDIANVPEGPLQLFFYDVNTGAPLNAEPVVGEVRPEDDQGVVVIDAALNVRTGVVTGIVRTADGVPLTNTDVTIGVRTAAGGALLAATVGADGRFSLPGVMAGPWGFEVEGAWRRNRLVLATVRGTFAESGETVDLVVEMPLARGTVSGRVVEADLTTGAAGVTLWLPGGPPDWISYGPSVLTGPDGRYAFAETLLPTAPFEVSAYVPGLAEALTAQVTLSGGTATADFVLPGRLVTVSGRALASDGATSIPGAMVWIVFDPAGENQEVASAEADAEGRFTFEPVLLEGDSLTLRVQPDQYNWYWRFEFAVDATGQRAIDHTVLLPTTVIAGQVFFDAARTQPVPYPDVTAIGASGYEAFATYVDEQGRYRIYAMPAGRFTLRAQDQESGLLAVIDDPSLTVLEHGEDVATVDVQMPPSNVVIVRLTNAAGQPIVDYSAAMLTPTTAGTMFERFEGADSNGEARFERTPVGQAYVQVAAWEPEVLASASVVVEDEATAPSGVVVSFQAPPASGAKVKGFVRANGEPVWGWVRVLSTGGAGPLGYYDRSVSTDIDPVSGQAGYFEALRVPAGVVTAQYYDWITGSAGTASGVLDPAQGDLVLDVAVGSAVVLTANLDAGDGFRYDVGGRGALRDGGKADRTLTNAYDYAYELTIDDHWLSDQDVAGVELSGRQLAVGPYANRALVLTRKVYVPERAQDGFARYLELLTNPTDLPQTVTVQVQSYLGSHGATTIAVNPASVGNRYGVTAASDGRNPALGHVFRGTGTPAAGVEATYFSEGEGYVSYAWRVTVPPNATVAILHFAIQREPADTAGVQSLAEALSSLTDPEALAGLTAAERAAIVNFVVP